VSPLALAHPLFSPEAATLERFCENLRHDRLQKLGELSASILQTGSTILSPRADCLAALQAAGALLEADSPSSPHFEAFAALALRAYGKGEEEQSIKEAAKESRDIAKDLLSLAAYLANFPIQKAVLERLDEYAAELAEAKRLANIMDFKDLGACAIHCLTKDRDLRAAWKRDIRSIVIDEFQDNNSLQKDILYLLAEKENQASESIPKAENLEEGKLFFVGDEKQSIYRFRGAEVEVFRTLADELSSAEGLRHKILRRNYRSAVPLLRFFDGFFSQVFASGDAGPPWEARHAPMEPGSSTQERGLGASSLRYFVVEPKEAGQVTLMDQDDSLAYHAASYVRDAVRSLCAGPEGRKITYEDMAILLRTTTHQHRLERFLRQFGIPYQSENPRGLFSEAPANDLYHILSYVVDPGDRRAFLATLRSPLCRISDRGFAVLAGAETGILLDPAPVMEAGLPQEDIEALARARIVLAELRSLARYAPVAETTDYLWNEGGLRLDLLTRPEAHSFLEHFDFIFRIAARVDEESGTLADFLALVKPYIDGDEEKMDLDHTPRPAAPGVHILTIHKSKGLQFPLVIIPWADNSGSAKRENSIWHPLGKAIAIDAKPFDVPGAKSSNIVLDMAKEEEASKNEAEIRRLLYVACTRAQDHLVFFAKAGSKTLSPKSFMFYLEAYASGESSLKRETLGCAPISRLRTLLPASNGFTQEAFTEAYRTASTFKPSHGRRVFTATELSEAHYLASQADEEAFIRGEGAGKAFRDDPPIPPEVFGNLAHYLVQEQIRTGNPASSLPPPGFLDSYDPEEVAKAFGLAAAMAERFMESPVWRGIPGEARRETEKAFILNTAAGLVEGRMDFFAETETDILILDFKTDKDIQPQRYAMQLDIYAAAAKALAPGKKIRCGLFLLRDGLVLWKRLDQIDRMAI
jgi:ATP-dependent exoDNAse (exonuclease V) beta subunit